MLERKKSAKLKSLFRPQQEVAATLNKKAAGQLKISSPILQHSTSIYSLVSPIRTTFSNQPMPSNALLVRSMNKRPERPEHPLMGDESCIKAHRNRRHSCSSTILYDGQQGPKPQPPKSTFYNKLRDRRRSSTKSGNTNAAASVVTIEPSISKSTPLLHKVKTYNVGKRAISKDELEKQKKIKELEDLITGRRGSTLKLTLTPKGL
ncbi:hypothetical protein G6F57_001784 [Rhizopus arrhizus]|uniref:Uncharacterized protein n=1 Tax=Rhizopus oryzae TaxID=64495 RepID=A0A9P7BT05_RHIOR|nr:hypothetical protein G6F23_005061 [Rhizopus arrhizus]KAG1425450.1 hypothetical protein G6F58_001915 [Rhizopus delemar]KAG0914649.1 hypothetical protein G6F33_004070 [Rhizopus arrhizus]KAG0948209.1 hypothetical protein G6F30_002881 [Rhizopus arrhizus]KAG0956712.1 hypothetical protein G6F32_001799 [Rhizopus arrhizus]